MLSCFNVVQKVSLSRIPQVFIFEILLPVHANKTKPIKTFHYLQVPRYTILTACKTGGLSKQSNFYYAFKQIASLYTLWSKLVCFEEAGMRHQRGYQIKRVSHTWLRNMNFSLSFPSYSKWSPGVTPLIKDQTKRDTKYCLGRVSSKLFWWVATINKLAFVGSTQAWISRDWKMYQKSAWIHDCLIESLYETTRAS